MNKEPLVSVIIPTYKRSESLCRAIDSILNQTYSNIEIIVVDDNGKGSIFQLETEKELERYINSGDIIYITHETNKNGAAARNTGFNISKGEYINFLDDDDIFLPNKLELQVNKLSKDNHKYGATYCNTRIIRKRKISKKPLIVETNYSEEGNLLMSYLCQEITFNTSSILFRRNTITELGGFDESFYRHQDYELMTRFFQRYEISCSGYDPLIVYDLEVDRMNMPNVERAIQIEEKFISTFKDLFLSISGGNKICKHLYINCLCQALQSRQYSYMPLIYKKIRRYGLLGVSDCFQLARNFIIGLI